MKLLKEKERSGMIERLLENWLTNTNERGYQIPFCQLLVSQGYKILYISPHGIMEEGKDIIALSPKGKPEAFQLKNGDISLAAWRSIEGEIHELVTIPPQHPSVNEKLTHKSWLVANGALKDPVRTQIVTRNRDNWGQKKKRKLDVMDKQYLLNEFAKNYGSFFPTDPTDFNSFLELYLSKGNEMFPVEKYSKVAEAILHINDSQVKSTNLQNYVSSSIILTSYILTPWTLAKNYVAAITAWISLLSYIYSAATKFNVDIKKLSQSIEIIDFAIQEEFNGLLEDVKSRKHLVEGDWMSDPAVYKYRVTYVLGFLCSYALYCLLKDGKVEDSLGKNIIEICKKYEEKMGFYGESGIPLFLSYFWANEFRNEERVVGNLIILIDGMIDQLKFAPPLGFPSPYYDLEQSVEILTGLVDEDPMDFFSGSSFSLRSLVEIFVRRKFRPFLETRWRKISHTQFVEFKPDKNWQFFTWRSNEGKLDSTFPNPTESWNRLKTESFELDLQGIPKILQDNPHHLLLILLIFPHRMNHITTRFLDLKIKPKLTENY